MIRNKVIVTIPGWQNSAVRTRWENQLFMSEKDPLNVSWMATSNRYLVLAGCEERVIFFHGS